MFSYNVCAVVFLILFYRFERDQVSLHYFSPQRDGIGGTFERFQPVENMQISGGDVPRPRMHPASHQYSLSVPAYVLGGSDGGRAHKHSHQSHTLFWCLYRLRSWVYYCNEN